MKDQSPFLFVSAWIEMVQEAGAYPPFGVALFQSAVVAYSSGIVRDYFVYDFFML